jgi:hypothetical protein
MKVFSFIHKVNNPTKVTTESVLTSEKFLSEFWTSCFNPRDDRNINERNYTKIKNTKVC